MNEAMTHSRDDLRQIGKYRLIGKLGEGGQAHVYLALQSGPGEFHKLVVVKVLRTDLDVDSDSIASFMQEARVAAQVNHPFIVQTYEVGEEGGLHYIVMEYVSGQSLRAIERKLSPDHIPMHVHLAVLADVARALHHVHTLKKFDGSDLNLVHRDVSPQNIMVSYDGTVKLLDFGIAKVGDESRTREGMIKGKVAYMAPEQVTGGKVDRRSDVFALGVLFWQAVSGRRFMDPKLSEIVALQNRILGKEPRLREVAPDAPASIVAACDRALSVEPEQRQATAEEFAEEITRYLSETSGASGPRPLAQLVTKLFEDERARVASLIESQVKAASRSGEVQVRALYDRAGGDTRSDEAAISASAVRAAGRTSDPPTKAALPSSKRPSEGRSAGVWAAGAVGLVALVGGAAWLASAPAGTSVAALIDAGVAAPAAPQTVVAHIEVVPAEATVFLDGRAIATAEDVELPRDDRTHELVARAEGFEEARREVSLTRDLAMHVELRAVAPAETEAPSTPAATGAFVARSRRVGATQAARRARPRLRRRGPRRPSRWSRRPRRRPACFGRASTRTTRTNDVRVRCHVRNS